MNKVFVFPLELDYTLGSAGLLEVVENSTLRNVNRMGEFSNIWFELFSTTKFPVYRQIDASVL